jgi:hypothetical protein
LIDIGEYMCFAGYNINTVILRAEGSPI